MESQQSLQDTATIKRRRPNIGPVTLLIISVTTLLLTAAGWSLATFGSIQRAISYHLGGATLLIEPNEKSFGAVSPGDAIDVRFRLVNRGRETVRVLGCRASCLCIVPDDLPFSLSPNESHDLVFSVNNPKPGERGTLKPSNLRFEIALLTNNASQPEVPLIIKGEVRDQVQISE